MAMIRTQSEYVDIVVPGARTKRVKGEEVKRRTKPVEDMWEVAELFEKGEYPLLVVDTLTIMLNKALRQIANEDLSASDTKETRRSGFDIGGKRITNPTLQDYGMLISVMSEWFEELWQICQANESFVIFTGHEGIVSQEDENEVTISAIGSIDAPGRKIGPRLPANMQATLRITRQRVKGKRASKRIVMAEDDGLWKAKDRLGIWAPDGTEIDVPRKDGEDPDAHKERIVRSYVDLWKRWFTAADKRNAIGTVALYGPPGAGKTLMAAGAAVAMKELTGEKTLFFDVDGEGTLVLPEFMVQEPKPRRVKAKASK
ncbi:MAG: ATP-binding protein [Deltaproteobacteria bacterium]|nr:MAG: ATP-binding protein [Deltaproteobacteria bacterium]